MREKIQLDLFFRVIQLGLIRIFYVPSMLMMFFSFHKELHEEIYISYLKQRITVKDQTCNLAYKILFFFYLYLFIDITSMTLKSISFNSYLL